MDYKTKYNVFVGAMTGRLMGVRVKQIAPVQTENMYNLISSIGHHDITCMSWGDDEEKEILLGCGLKEERSLKTFNRQNQTFSSSFTCDLGKGPINGIVKCNGNVFTSVQSGHIILWNNSNGEYLLDAGENLLRMRQNESQRNLIATGGDENPLKIFDLESKTNIFTAKNVPHDSLQLRVPINITDLCFFEKNQVFTVGKYGHVRAYDARKQRRPIINMDLKEQALITVTPNIHKEKEFICGTGTGRIFSIDLRHTGKVLKIYKGPVGAVTALAVSKEDQVVVSTSLDRHLYVHDINTNVQLKKVYLVSKLTSMVLASDFSLNDVKKEEDNQESVIIDDVDILDEIKEEYYSDCSEESND